MEAAAARSRPSVARKRTLAVLANRYGENIDYSPSLMLAMPGCWAWEEMGALLAGVFCGVLNVKIRCQYHRYHTRIMMNVFTYGAVMSGRRFLMGSAIVKFS
jgi:hypothetical protein